MSEPRIQYAQTKDGVSIAFWTLGEGAGTNGCRRSGKSWRTTAGEPGCPSGM
jgi:hypothetical protein